MKAIRERLKYLENVPNDPTTSLYKVMSQVDHRIIKNALTFCELIINRGYYIEPECITLTPSRTISIDIWHRINIRKFISVRIDVTSITWFSNCPIQTCEVNGEPIEFPKLPDGILDFLKIEPPFRSKISFYEREKSKEISD